MLKKYVYYGKYWNKHNKKKNCNWFTKVYRRIIGRYVFTDWFVFEMLKFVMMMVAGRRDAAPAATYRLAFVLFRIFMSGRLGGDGYCLIVGRFRWGRGAV